MPKSHLKKNEKSKAPGRKDVLHMMGYGEDEDDSHDDDGMEAELAAILGTGSSKSQAKKKPPPKLLDWSVIDAQVASSMQDVDQDSDEDITADDEDDFMDELNDLVDDEPDLLKPEPVKPRPRSPSPQPGSSGDMLQLLKDRKQMYEAAIANAQSTGQSSKVRRLQRGLKTLDGLLRSAKAGKSVKEDDIPPPVATGQSTKPSSAATSPSQSDASLSSSPRREPVVTTAEDSPVVQKPTPPARPTPNAVPTPLVQIAAPSTKSDNKTTDATSIQLLESRQHEYREATLAAKRAGNKEDALKYFKVLKQFDAVITAAKNGQDIDLSKMPPSLHDQKTILVPQKAPSPEQPRSSAPQPPQTQPSAGSQPGALTRPKTVLEALEQRMTKYQSTADEANKEGNGGKARRMGRIVKQYKDAIRSHKAGRNVNYDELPVPPGYPPIPGVKEIDREENLMQKASALLQENPDEAPGSSQQADPSQGLSPPTSAARKASPQRIGDSSTHQKAAPSHSKQAAKEPSTAYEKQISFLQNRQAAFKRAALAAKQRGDRTAALDYLRKMKGFDDMIEAAKGGMRVDITKVPQPPAEFSSPPKPSRDEGFEVIEGYEISSRSKHESSRSKNTPEEDDALYSRVLDSLEQQIKKARAYAQQMTHSGDVSGAERADRLAGSSQADLDYVRSCRRHGDSPPRFYYEDQVFKMVRMNPDLGSDELELTIVQCIDLRGVKDPKVFVEFEMPFPHSNPIKSKTDEAKGSPQNPQFQGANFRVPFNRKLKSNHRAIKKAIKLEIIQKGGFLRSDKAIASASIKLSPLENHSEIHAVEELKDGRNSVGKIEAYVKLRTPLLASDSQTVKERWLHVEHVKRVRHVAPVPSSKKSPPPRGSGTVISRDTGTASRSSTNMTIAALPVLELDLKILSARIAECRKKKTSHKEYEREAIALQEKIDGTRKYLREGGSHAKSEYVKCLSSHYEHLNVQAQAYAKQQKREQAKLALTKRSLIKKELESYETRKT